MGGATHDLSPIAAEADGYGSSFSKKVTAKQASAKKPFSRRPIITDAKSKSSLSILATNEYGEFDRVALTLYDMDMLVEPHRKTTLTVEGFSEQLGHMSGVTFRWHMIEADENGDPLVGARPILDALGGPEATVTLAKTGTIYDLRVKQYGGDGSLVAVQRMKVSCKYVRREIRSLTEDDREAFFQAMEIFFTIPTEVGQARYGEKFFNYERITAYHDSKITDYCYHDGMQFLTSHAAFDLVMERYLQMINPKVTLPIWDFMIESATMGAKWYDSVIFSDDWFGSALGHPENNFMVKGRFENVSTIYDPDRTLVDHRVRPNHNAYGYITSVNNYQDVPRLTRTSSYCGLTSHATFATVETFVGCFDDEDNLYDWETCMETKVHGDLHGLLGGGFNCNTDMKAFSDQHPEYSVGLLSFVLEYLTFNYWPMNEFIPSANVCDTECTKGQTEKCGCTCLIDAFAISDAEVYSYVTTFMKAAISKFTGDKYIVYDADAEYPYGFMQDDERLSDEESLLLMRYLIKLGCEPASVGYMSTGASPLDPIFWVLHPMFEKAMHILWLSPQYRDNYTFEWVDGSCSGSGYTDELPFTENLLGLGTGKTFITNQQLLELMHPKNPQMPYVYESFAQWGNTDSWDPCPTCKPKDETN